MSEDQDDLFELFRNYSDFLDRAWILLNDISVSLDSHSYLYAALDLRFSIERLLSIHLILVSRNNINKSQNSLYRVKDFVTELKKIDNDYLLSIKEIIDKIENANCIKLPTIDFKKLDILYGQLGNLLHLNDLRVFYIEEKDKLDNIEQIVLGAYKYLEQFRDYEKLLKDYIEHN